MELKNHLLKEYNCLAQASVNLAEAMNNFATRLTQEVIPAESRNQSLDSPSVKNHLLMMCALALSGDLDAMCESGGAFRHQGDVATAIEQALGWQTELDLIGGLWNILDRRMENGWMKFQDEASKISDALFPFDADQAEPPAELSAETEPDLEDFELAQLFGGLVLWTRDRPTEKFLSGLAPEVFVYDLRHCDDNYSQAASLENSGSVIVNYMGTVLSGEDLLADGVTARSLKENDFRYFDKDRETITKTLARLQKKI